MPTISTPVLTPTGAGRIRVEYSVTFATADLNVRWEDLVYLTERDGNQDTLDFVAANSVSTSGYPRVTARASGDADDPMTGTVGGVDMVPTAAPVTFVRSIEIVPTTTEERTGERETWDAHVFVRPKYPTVGKRSGSVGVVVDLA